MASGNPPTGAGAPAQSICRYFAATGNCFYGDQCNFLHVGAQTASSSALARVPKSQIACRNIAVHGFCKFQGKGCEYNHEVGAASEPTPRFHSVPDLKSARDDPTLASKWPAPASVSAAGARAATPTYDYNEAFVPTRPGPTAVIKPSAPITPTKSHPGRLISASSDDVLASPVSKSPGPSHHLIGSPMQMNSSFTLPHIGRPPTPGRLPTQVFFMSESLRQELVKRLALINARLEPDDPLAKALPAQVHRYHSLLPLEDSNTVDKAPKVFPVPSTMYKATSSVDGFCYALRQLEGYKPPYDLREIMGLLDPWLKQVRHPNIVTLREIFLSKEFSENSSLFFAYDYHPASFTLETKYFLQPGSNIAETVLWSFLLQLTSALRSIHAAGVACRSLHPSKILVTGKNRLRISSAGVTDLLLQHDTSKSLVEMQTNDLVQLGRLILCLASRSLAAVNEVPQALEQLAAQYSPEFCSVVSDLVAPQPLDLEKLVVRLAPRAFQDMDNLHNFTDLLEGELMKEVENGRLFRLVAQLGFINERPEFDVDPAWSESGDRYLLKLFRDYVFHQTYEDGTPAIDLGHVVETLNKLDVGAHEKILLMSRDEQSMLVVSYADLKRCADAAFQELLQKSQLAASGNVLK